MTKARLELTWIGKETRPKLEPRILLEDKTKSYHAKHRVSDNDLFDNRFPQRVGGLTISGQERRAEIYQVDLETKRLEVGVRLSTKDRSDGLA